MTAYGDMTVYKLIDRMSDGSGDFTPYQRTQANRGDTIRSRKPIASAEGKDRVGREGVHAYVDAETAHRRAVAVNDSRISYNYTMNRIHVVRAVIPSGERFYLGMGKEIAAGSMIIGDVIY